MLPLTLPQAQALSVDIASPSDMASLAHVTSSHITIPTLDDLATVLRESPERVEQSYSFPQIKFPTRSLTVDSLPDVFTTNLGAENVNMPSVLMNNVTRELENVILNKGADAIFQAPLPTALGEIAGALIPDMGALLSSGAVSGLSLLGTIPLAHLGVTLPLTLLPLGANIVIPALVDLVSLPLRFGADGFALGLPHLISDLFIPLHGLIGLPVAFLATLPLIPGAFVRGIGAVLGSLGGLTVLAGSALSLIPAQLFALANRLGFPLAGAVLPWVGFALTLPLRLVNDGLTSLVSHGIRLLALPLILGTGLLPGLLGSLGTIGLGVLPLALLTLPLRGGAKLLALALPHLLSDFLIPLHALGGLLPGFLATLPFIPLNLLIGGLSLLGSAIGLPTLAISALTLIPAQLLALANRLGLPALGAVLPWIGHALTLPLRLFNDFLTSLATHGLSLLGVPLILGSGLIPGALGTLLTGALLIIPQFLLTLPLRIIGSLASWTIPHIISDLLVPLHALNGIIPGLLATLPVLPGTLLWGAVSLFGPLVGLGGLGLSALTLIPAQLLALASRLGLPALGAVLPWVGHALTLPLRLFNDFLTSLATHGLSLLGVPLILGSGLIPGALGTLLTGALLTIPQFLLTFPLRILGSLASWTIPHIISDLLIPLYALGGIIPGTIAFLFASFVIFGNAVLATITSFLSFGVSSISFLSAIPLWIFAFLVRILVPPAFFLWVYCSV